MLERLHLNVPLVLTVATLVHLTNSRSAGMVAVMGSAAVQSYINAFERRHPLRRGLEGRAGSTVQIRRKGGLANRELAHSS